MGLLNMFNKLITEHGSASIQKERVQLFQEQVELIDKENVSLRAENDSLKKQVKSLKSRIEEQKNHDDYINFKGVYFKRLPSGKFDEIPYCPKCKSGMYGLESFFPFTCGSCDIMSGFTQGEYEGIMEELKKEYPV